MFLWEPGKKGFCQRAAVSRAVRFQECPLSELDLFFVFICLLYSPSSRGFTHIRAQPPSRDVGQHFDFELGQVASDAHKFSTRGLHVLATSFSGIIGQLTLPARSKVQHVRTY